MTILKALAALSVTIISTNALASNPAFQKVSGAYGSVEYSANVTCGATGSTYTFSVSDLHLTFHPETNVNKVNSIVNPQLRMATTIRRSGATCADVTSKSLLPLALTLDKKHATATVSNRRFVIAAKKVRESTYTVLSLTDGHLFWPFEGNLKSCALSST